MYAIKVEVQGPTQTSELVPDGDDDDAGYLQVFREVPGDLECVSFSAGNPRVEHVAGLVHLYRRNEPAQTGGAGGSGGGAAAPSGPTVAAPAAAARSYSQAVAAGPAAAAGAAAGAAGAEHQQQGDPGRSPTLCCLAIPADMPVAGFCGFVGAYMRHVKHMRVLRREGPAQSVCMVLLTFDSQEQADAFLHDYNGQPFSSLEPEILCRLVYVRSVECLGVGGGSSGSGGGSGGRRGDGAKTAAAAAAAAPAGGAGGSGGGGGGERQAGQEIQAAADERRGGGGSDACVAAVEDAGGGALEPPAGHTELPTCPVCLERLDEHISGIVTTVCNHQFHGECLKAWGDTSCPVCRYCTYGSTAAGTSRCATCGTGANLWICLICGHVGCGRYRSGHASEHWKASSHCYALELETQRVWDYAGDGYVHRLIQSKTDGKLVEVPSPAPACGHHHHPRRRGSAPCGAASSGGGATYGGAPAGGSRRGGGDDGGDSGCEACAQDRDMKDAMAASKLDAIAFEYNHLLTSQLDSQRQYFEALLEQQRAELEGRAAAGAAAAERVTAEAAAAGAAAKEAERKRAALERKLSDSQEAAKKLGEEREFLRSLNDTLLANQKAFAEKLRAAEAAAAAKDAAIVDLQEQVRDLMVFIEAGRHVQQEGGGLAEATLLPLPQQEGGSGKGKRRGGRK